jgi:hypothetical protein
MVKGTKSPRSLGSPSFSRSSPAFNETFIARPFCLVQFEQRSGDNFAVRFRLPVDRDLGFSFPSISIRIRQYLVENMETGEGVNSRKRQQIL